MKKVILLLFVSFVAFNSSYCQTKLLPATIGINAGLTEYTGDLGQGMYKFSDANPFFGLYFGYFISNHLDMNFNLSYGKLSYKEDHNLKFSNNLLRGGADFHIKLLDAAKYKAAPFLIAGIGLARYSDHSLKTTDDDKDVQIINGNGTDAFFAFGAGVKFNVGEKFSVFIAEKFAYTDHDDRDGEERNTNDAFLMHTIGIGYNFSKNSDLDRDGVSDNHDKCPGTPATVKVNSHGCPIDQDGDGIADYLDDCPEVIGVASAKGCPDKDGDGIADNSDKCPEVFGVAAMEGCPDKDGDGITDNDDKCPDAAGKPAMNGCPDQDDDGIADNDDGCPADKGSKEMNGCPDKDNDAVADKDDKCPDTPGIIANKGCPEVKEEVKKVFATALQGIQFETGKAVIRSSSFSVLNKVVKVMNDNPEYKLSIEGHTDNEGSSEKNMDLSNRRANAVMKYLTDHKIDGSRLRANGYGDTKPVGSNSTSAGRAKNRRVEFKVEF